MKANLRSMREQIIFANSCSHAEELIEAVRGLGKTSIGEVNKEDLFALDEFIAKGLGIPLCHEKASKQ